MDFPIARQLFYQEIQQPDPTINLAKAALHVAQEEYPDLDPEEYLAALDTMAAEVAERLPPDPYPMRIINTLNQYLFEDLGYQGNIDHYYDPRNSFLNDVVDRRTGIPISLSLIYLEIARRIDFPMVGIGMPGHFLIRPDFEDAGIFVDTFHRGEILFPEDCQERLSHIYGHHVTLQPHFLDPIPPRRFLFRLLTNLKHIYLNRADMERSLAVIERILLLDPEAIYERRDRGILYYQMGRWVESRHDLEAYLSELPPSQHHSPDVDIIRQLLDHMGRDND